jgi:hypothetical protein
MSRFHLDNENRQFTQNEKIEGKLLFEIQDDLGAI